MVVAIIAVLAAILFPVFSQAKVAAKATACASNLRQMQLGATLYMADYDDTYPLAAYPEGPGVRIWHDLIDPYLKNKEVWWCPTSSVGQRDANGAETTHFAYNARYLTDLRLDFSNADGHRAVGAGAVGDPAGTAVFVTSLSSVPGSWCGDDGKYLLLVDDPDLDCWGRPDPNAALRATIAWADTHVGRRRLAEFYSGQNPRDRWFDLE